MNRNSKIEFRDKIMDEMTEVNVLMRLLSKQVKPLLLSVISSNETRRLCWIRIVTMNLKRPNCVGFAMRLRKINKAGCWISFASPHFKRWDDMSNLLSKSAKTDNETKWRLLVAISRMLDETRYWNRLAITRDDAQAELVFPREDGASGCRSGRAFLSPSGNLKHDSSLSF